MHPGFKMLKFFVILSSHGSLVCLWIDVCKVGMDVLSMFLMEGKSSNRVHPNSHHLDS